MKNITKLSLLLLLMGSFLINQPLSAQGSKEIVEVANLTELRAQEDFEAVYMVTGEVILTHQHAQRNQKYFQDDGAAIVVDDPDGIITTSYNLYDGVTGLTGTLSLFQNLLQFTPTVDPGDAVSTGNEVEPMVITFAELAPEHQAMLIRVNEVEFIGEQTSLTPSTSFPLEDPSGEGLLRTPGASAQLDYFNTPVPTGANDMIALVSQFQEVMQIFPRSLADFFPDGVPSYDVTFVVIDEEDNPVTDAVITLGGVANAAGDYLFEEVEAGSYPYSIEKSGFYTRTGNVAVVGDDVNLTVVLVAIDPDAITELPWNEDFEGEDFPPSGWNHIALGAGTWATTDDTPFGDKAAFHALTAAFSESWLITPQIQLPEDMTMLLKFFQKNSFMQNYEPGESLSAVMISAGSGNPVHEEFVMAYEASAGIENYTERIVNLGDYAGEVVYIAFVYKGAASHNWYIDDIVIEEAPGAIELDNIAALHDAEVGDLIYQITGEVFITHQQVAYRGQIYIQDESGAVMIDDPSGIITTEYNNYDGITNLRGTLSVFQDMLQLVPVEDPGAPSSTGNTIEPMVVTLAELNQDIQAMLVRVVGVSFDFDHEEFPDTETFTHNQSYYIIDASGEGVIRTPNSPDLLDYFGTAIPTTPVDLVGVLHQRFDVTRLQPRSLADFLEPTSIEEIKAAGFNVFPNPARNQFTISGENNLDMVRIFNINGQLVREQNAYGNHLTLDISDLKTGIFIVQIVSGNQVLNYKLQVQR